MFMNRQTALAKKLFLPVFTFHAPRHCGLIAFRLECELGGVGGFEGPEEFELDPGNRIPGRSFSLPVNARASGQEQVASHNDAEIPPFCPEGV
jgi:hypothetical protein